MLNAEAVSSRFDGGATFVRENTNANYRVNRGVLALGSKADGMVAWNLFGKTGASAGLYFSGEVKLNDFNGIEVGSTLTRDTADVKLGAQSVLIVDAAQESGTTVEGSISTSEGSRLHFVNIDPEEGVSIKLDADFDTVTTDNLFVKVEKNESGGYGFAVETDGGTLSSLGLEGFDAQSMIALQKKDPYVASLLTATPTSRATSVMRSSRADLIRRLRRACRPLRLTLPMRALTSPSSARAGPVSARPAGAGLRKSRARP